MTTLVKSDIIYRGTPTHLCDNPDDGFACVKRNDGVYLKTRLNTIDHSPSGFSWGYAGSGPAQLALALLWDVLDDNLSSLYGDGDTLDYRYRGDYSITREHASRAKGLAKLVALRFYGKFKDEVIRYMPYESFELSQDYIWEWISDIVKTLMLLDDDYDDEDLEWMSEYFTKSEFRKMGYTEDLS